MIADKEENRINFCAAGDPAAVDGDDGVALVAADRQPEHGEDRHHGQGAGQEQQDGGGDHHHLLFSKTQTSYLSFFLHTNLERKRHKFRQNSINC